MVGGMPGAREQEMVGDEARGPGEGSDHVLFVVPATLEILFILERTGSQ